MFQVSHPKFHVSIAPHRRRSTSVAAPRAHERSTAGESIAAPLTLAAVVLATLMLAVAIALITALGG